MLMERDSTTFPADNLGDRLWNIHLSGFDFSALVEVEFSMIFPTQTLALQFGQMLLENNQKLSFCQYHGDEDFPWEITAYPTMGLAYENLIAYQNLLEDNAETYQGKFDGWFCVDANEPIE